MVDRRRGPTESFRQSQQPAWPARPRRGQRASAGAETSGARAGPPLDYDPQAPTGPLPLSDVSRSRWRLRPRRPCLCPPRRCPRCLCPPRLCRMCLSRPRRRRPRRRRPRPCSMCLRRPCRRRPRLRWPCLRRPRLRLTVPEVVATRAKVQDKAALDAHLEQTPPGLNITEAPEQIGYPREVVPGAELVKRVSSGRRYTTTSLGGPADRRGATGAGGRSGRGRRAASLEVAGLEGPALARRHERLV